jgi:hypothetical protein
VPSCRRAVVPSCRVKAVPLVELQRREPLSGPVSTAASFGSRDARRSVPSSSVGRFGARKVRRAFFLGLVAAGVSLGCGDQLTDSSPRVRREDVTEDVFRTLQASPALLSGALPTVTALPSNDRSARDVAAGFIRLFVIRGTPGTPVDFGHGGTLDGSSQVCGRVSYVGGPYEYESADALTRHLSGGWWAVPVCSSLKNGGATIYVAAGVAFKLDANGIAELYPGNSVLVGPPRTTRAEQSSADVISAVARKFGVQVSVVPQRVTRNAFYSPWLAEWLIETSTASAYTTLAGGTGRARAFLVATTSNGQISVSALPSGGGQARVDTLFTNIPDFSPRLLRLRPEFVATPVEVR